MGLSKETRIKIFIGVDVAFFLLEIIVGYAAHSLALVADAFHMLNDVISLCVGLWAVRVASQKSKSNEYTYGWDRAELIGGLINGVFLVALCLSIFLDAIQRFVEPQEVSNPKLVFIVGGVGLAFNILGLFVFHQHSHDHGHEHGEEEHEHEHADALNTAEHGHIKHDQSESLDVPAHGHTHGSPKVSWRNDDSAKQQAPRSSSGRRPSTPSNPRRSRTRSVVDDIPIYPASLRNEFRKSARMGEAEDSGSSDEESAVSVADVNENTALLSKDMPRDARKSPKKRKSRSHDHGISALDGAGVDHKHHRHNKPKGASTGGHGHSHADMNIRGLFLHVLGDALGNVGVMASALIIWLTTSPSRYYADPAISLVITLIILKTAVPMCKDTAKPLLQATPEHVDVDDIKLDIESLDGVRDCHHIHVWALTPSKLIATLDVELTFDFEGRNAARYMQLAREIKRCLDGHGIHNSTIQPEFCLNPEHKDENQAALNSKRSESSTSTVQTAIAAGPLDQQQGRTSGTATPHGHAACLLERNDDCGPDRQCCGPRQNESGTTTPKHGDNEGRSKPK